jgi:5-methyltetrahydrofolate--homocysteine methyltransferase
MYRMSDVLMQIVEVLYQGDDESVSSLTQKALDEGIEPGEVLKNGLLAGMDRVGVDFRAGDLFVPEVLISARAMHAGMDILRPLLSESDMASSGKIVIGTVQGDMHDIGKNLVGMMLEGGGFEVIDIGIDLSPDRFVEVVKAERPNIVGMSALLTTTMQNMRHTIDALENAGLREEVSVIIGGAPVTKEYADEIGADGYAPDAGSAVELARSLMKQ